MSFEDGWAAINLQAPPRIPRVEFSITAYHWELMRAVTGIPVNEHSTEEMKLKAVQNFIRKWNYDIYFDDRFDSQLVASNQLSKKMTNMGHARYAVNGTDFQQASPSPFHDLEDVFRFDPWEVYSSIDKKQWSDRFTRYYRLCCKLFPTAVNSAGVYITLITGLTYIFGWEWLLIAAGTDPIRFGEVTNRYAAWIQQYYDALAESEVELVGSHDDMVWAQGAIFHPDWYRKYVFPNYKKFWSPLRESGKKILFVCDGDYLQFAQDVAACGNHGFYFEIPTDFRQMLQRFGKTHFLIGGPDTRTLMSGTKERIREEVERCVFLGRDCPGYFLSVSNHIPPNVPVENAIFYNEVYQQLSRR